MTVRETKAGRKATGGRATRMGYYEEAERLARRLGMEVEPRDQWICFVADTPERLADVISRRLGFLGLNARRVAEASGVDLGAVRRLAESGRGSLSDTYAVLDALHLRPVSIPCPEAEDL